MTASRRGPTITLMLGLLAAPLATDAQPTGKFYRIGVLSGASAPIPVDHPAFLKGLRERGYVPGQNLIFEERYAGGTDRLPALAAELAGLNVDVIVTIGTPAARAAKAATQTIPVVFTIQANPVERGLVASLARPGGNLTGLTAAPEELEDKRLELLKQAVPRASRLAYLRDANYGPATWVANWAAPRVLGLQLLLVELTDLHPRELADFAAKSRLPAIAAKRSFAEAGLLMSYGVDLVAQGERRAAFVDKILKGTRPADLPVEQSSKLELVINLKTAKALGLTIPPSVLARAGEVIQ